MFLSDLPEVPTYLKRAFSIKHKTYGRVLIAIWGDSGEWWVFSHNINQHCWTSLHKLTVQDVEHLKQEYAVTL